MRRTSMSATSGGGLVCVPVVIQQRPQRLLFLPITLIYRSYNFTPFPFPSPLTHLPSSPRHLIKCRTHTNFLQTGGTWPLKTKTYTKTYSNPKSKRKPYSLASHITCPNPSLPDQQVKDMCVVIQQRPLLHIRPKRGPTLRIQRLIEIRLPRVKPILAQHHRARRQRQVVRALYLRPADEHSRHDGVLEEEHGSTALAGVAVVLDGVCYMAVPPAVVVHGGMGAMVTGTTLHLFSKTRAICEILACGAWRGESNGHRHDPGLL